MLLLRWNGCVVIWANKFFLEPSSVPYSIKRAHAQSRPKLVETCADDQHYR